MSERCEKCQRKKRRSAKAEHPDICHLTASSECLAAAGGFTRGHVRGAREPSSHLRNVIHDSCYDGDEDTIDSLGVNSFANAMRFLAASGRIRIEADSGAFVVGRWT